ncbi:hypothetical protein BIW11_13309 [Tropilaelaps mercedesae]|uniref:Uncharacterized protein n=1 Tax=Tropilaelaps mercedesae TaxID=418985 RepID=A0A1V9X3E5_9ACAR|nr:hypothetical protein BIW11_13309 [Tropilaelaps mercedesae]
MLTFMPQAVVCGGAMFSCLILSGIINLSRSIMCRFRCRSSKDDSSMWSDVMKGAVRVPPENLSQIRISVTPATPTETSSTYGPYHTYQQGSTHPYDIEHRHSRYVYASLTPHGLVTAI